MRAAWYEQQGQARDVLEISEMAAERGELRIRIVASGIKLMAAAGRLHSRPSVRLRAPPSPEPP